MNFSGFTVGDMLKKRTPGSRVVGISLKDRSAILMAGPRADAAYWFDVMSGGFETSTYYAKTPPAWLMQWNARRLADSPQWRTWTRLLPDEAPYLKYAGPDAVKGEYDNVDIVFPHRSRQKPSSAAYYDDLRRTPFGDEILLDAALAAMTAHQLGADDDPDVFAVSFSSSDVVGHTYGMDSQEQMDEYLRLDLTLGRLFDEIDRRVGLDRVIIGLSADHGAMPLVENLVAHGVPARRVRVAEIQDPVTRALGPASERRTASSPGSRRRISTSTSRRSRGAGGRAATWRRWWRRRSWRRASSRRCTRRSVCWATRRRAIPTSRSCGVPSSSRAARR